MLKIMTSKKFYGLNDAVAMLAGEERESDCEFLYDSDDSLKLDDHDPQNENIILQSTNECDESSNSG